MGADFRKYVVRIPTNEGYKLYGVLVRPRRKRDRKCLIISCQSGVVAKTEIGDHLRWLADRLAENGFSVLRFDQQGTGDSQGEAARDIPVRSFFRNVQDGCFVDDTITVLDWAIRRYADYSIFLLGECGGCISAMAAGAKRLEYIQGLILIAPPVLRFSDSNEGGTRIGAVDVKNIRKQYRSKILNWQSWTRLIHGQSDLRLIYRVITAQFSILRKKVNARMFGLAVSKPDNPDFNMLFWKNFQILTKASKKLCFILPELDNETFEFDVEFKDKVLKPNKSVYKNCSIVYLPEADHSIMFPQSRRNLFQHCFEWLKKISTTGENGH